MAKRWEVRRRQVIRTAWASFARFTRANGAVDTVIQRADSSTQLRFYKADVALKDGRIAGLARRATPDTPPNVDNHNTRTRNLRFIAGEGAQS